MGLERGALKKNLTGMLRDLLPPLLAPTVLLVLRLVLRVRVGKIAAVTKLQDIVHRDQRGTRRQRLKAPSLPFLEYRQ
jgi:hypothetical protein